MANASSQCFIFTLVGYSELFLKWGLDQFEFDHLLCLINNSRACFFSVLVRKKYGKTIRPQPCLNSVILVLITYIFVRKTGPLFFLSFGLKMMIFWMHFRSSQYDLPIRIGDFGNCTNFSVRKIWANRKKCMFCSKENGECKWLLPQFTWVFQPLLMTSSTSTIRKENVVSVGKTSLKDSPYCSVLRKYPDIVVSTKLLVILGFWHYSRCME